LVEHCVEHEAWGVTAKAGDPGRGCARVCERISHNTRLAGARGAADEEAARRVEWPAEKREQVVYLLRAVGPVLEERRLTRSLAEVGR